MLKSLKNMFGNNKEIENLNQVISEKDNKITELQTNLNKLIEENNNLKQLIPNDSKQIIQLREQLDAMEKLADVKKTNIASLNSNIENLKSIIIQIRNVRANMNVHPSKKSKLIFVSQNHKNEIENCSLQRNRL